MAYHGHNKRADFTTSKPIGVITRGTTGFNRLRKSDRWAFHQPAIRAACHLTDSPLAIDIGYGASHTTTCEWARWLRTVNPAMRVIGLEIDPARVLPPRDGVQFEQGGFELAGHRPQLARAFNVLRQYDVNQVHAAWDTVLGRIDPQGYFIEGTCDEIGRLATWVLLSPQGPQSLTLAWNPWSLDTPSGIAERLPKILIHRNTPGNKIHSLLSAADRAWDLASGFAPFGPRVRWFEASKILRSEHPEFQVPRPRMRRDNILSVPWHVVE
ncbi:class I SAM-dependent methyltransferase [Corynebacterium sp. ES2715-CONJ3]|uniref:class I SAM-dependent methyltransferase n=1 Tax=Corynebacterium sp. ES2715-CONJ3 TaxID=2974028 RepID=UPI002168941E|nr:class I SAM-dependent methyltransferase [Corynebacterium sp. ES2715-CONJ3]MCS4491251.1 class I SAM-dependent methyltransferase [Corynebacterium sp. ES2715-CONJ3]